MTEKELAVLGQFAPQDYLQFMQGTWAKVTVLTPGKLGVQETFSRFFGVLNEFETLVVEELRSETTILLETLRSLETLRKKTDNAFQELQTELKSYDGLLLFGLLNTY